MALSFSGAYSALVTPFHDDAQRSIDWAAFEAFVEFQINGGLSGLVPCGTTGESPALTETEHLAVVAKTVQIARGRIPVIAGTGSSSTTHAIHLSREAEKLGADAVMVVVPYYNKPSQEGLFHHFVSVAESVAVPVVLYNIPGRSAVDLTAETLARIAEAAPNVVATKEATGNVVRCMEIVHKLGDRMTVLSGDDGLTVPMMSVGAKGVISVTSNLLPREVSEVVRLALAGDFAAAKNAHLALLELHAAMFLDANPSPVKEALSLRKMMSSAVRQPLAEVAPRVRDILRNLLAARGLL